MTRKKTAFVQNPTANAKPRRTAPNFEGRAAAMTSSVIVAARQAARRRSGVVVVTLEKRTIHQIHSDAAAANRAMRRASARPSLPFRSNSRSSRA